MEQFTIMRRANGELFTLMQKGEVYLALWPTLQSAIHYKTRNPQLRVFLPASVTSDFGHKNLAPLQKENMGLYLLADTNDAHFRDGQKISWEELAKRLPASSWVSAQRPEIAAAGFAEKTPNLAAAGVADSLSSLERLDNGGKPIDK